MKLIAAFLLALCACGCAPQYKPLALDREEQRNLVDGLTYIKDARGNCFAVLHNSNAYGRIASIASVPCLAAEESK